MTFDPSDVFQVTLGVSSCGAVIWLAFKLLQIMTGHNVLLAGQCVGAEEERPASTQQPKRFHYRLRLQNLESVHADYKLRVTIRGIPNGSHESNPNERVLSLVGWKPIDVIQDLGWDPLDPYYWCAEFQDLPAFDTWSFDVVLPCERIEFSVAFVGAGTKLAFAPSFGPYFAYDRVTIFASDRDEPRVRGPLSAPSKVVPLFLSILAITTHILVVTLSGFKIVLSSLLWDDLGFVAIELLAIWIGYFAIRRPVYPVISGYRFVTPPWSREKSPASKGLKASADGASSRPAVANDR